MLDPAGRIATWNLGAELIKGYKADEVIGEPIYRFYTPEDRAAHRPQRLLDKARAEGRAEDEGWRVRKDGTRFWADVVISAVRDHDGTLVGFVKVTRDLTERRQAEIDRITLAHTQEALRLRDEFMSIASHELRTPLVALQLQLDSLRAQSTNLDPRQLSKIDRANRNVQRLADLITTLLDASRIAQGRLNLHRKQLDIGVVVADVIDRLHEPAQDAKCSVVTEIESGVITSGDPLRIGQVVSNLLSNAFKYAAGTPVEVAVTRQDDVAIVRVADGGPGIPEAHLERVFGRFERAASRNFGGMGLGLFVAREIVVAHGGTIAARNREARGALLEVRLPIGNTADAP